MSEPVLRALLLSADQLFSCLPTDLAGGLAARQEEDFQDALRRSTIPRALITRCRTFHANVIGGADLIVLTTRVPVEADRKALLLASAVTTLRIAWRFLGAIVPVAFRATAELGASQPIRVAQLDDPWSWVDLPYGGGIYDRVNVDPTPAQVAEAIRAEASTWRRSP